MVSGISQLKAPRRFSPARRAARILIVDHDSESCKVMRGYLEQRGYAVATASTWASAEQLWREAAPDAAVLDSAVADSNLANLIPRLKANDPSLTLVVLVETDCVGRAMEALRLGAEQFLPRPVELPVLAAVIQRTLEHQRLRRRELAERMRFSRQQLDPFVGESASIRVLADLAAKAAWSDCPVLIEGERGTGKRSLAWWLHQNGRRAAEPFVELHCGELSHALVKAQSFESKGGSDREKQFETSWLALAHRGTVLLSGIQKMDLAMQSRMLRLLAKEPPGGPAHGFLRTDVRVIAATQENISRLVHAKRFRADLCARISGCRLRIPPLRERLDDLCVLAAQILSTLARDLGNSDFDLSRGALRVLQSYPWPGNVRELKSVLERAVLATRSKLLTAADLQFNGQPQPQLAARAQFRNLKEVERKYIEQVLQEAGGRVQEAAKILGIPRSSLYHKLKQYQIERFGLRSAS
jgi:DNA-binding NtrC family response regulator